MDTVNASDAKREFGDVLLRAQKGPVGINKNGKPVAVIVSADEYMVLEQVRNAWLKEEIQKGVDDMNAGRVTDGAALLKRLRDRVRDAGL